MDHLIASVVMGHCVQTAEQCVLCSNVAVRMHARVCRLWGCSRTSDPSHTEQFCICLCPVALLSGTQYFGVAGDRIPLAADSVPADP